MEVWVRQKEGARVEMAVAVTEDRGSRGEDGKQRIDIEVVGAGGVDCRMAAWFRRR